MLGSLRAVIDSLTKWGKGPADVRATPFRSLAVALTEPGLFELNRAGRLFFARTTAVASGRAPVVDVPTTTANWCLYNPATHNKCLVAIAASAWLASGTADTGATLIGGVTPGVLATALAAHGAGHDIGCNRGTGASKAWLGIGTTVPTMAKQFNDIASMANQASTTPGNGMVGKIDGGLIIPPGFGGAFDVVSGVGTTAKYMIGILFAELDADLEGN